VVSHDHSLFALCLRHDSHSELLPDQAMTVSPPISPFHLSHVCVSANVCVSVVHCTEQTLDVGSNSLSGILPPSLSSLNKLTCVTLYTTHCLCPPFALRLGSWSK
jgi:hypothetical protein